MLRMMGLRVLPRVFRRTLKRSGRGATSLVAAAAALLALVSPLPAATVPTGYQEYFVIGREQQVWDMLYRVATSEGAAAFDNGATYWNGMNSVVSATASSDNQVIYYDHWEDGFEADLLNPPPGTTMVIGDGNPANGRACDFTTDPRILPCGGATEDILFQGSFVNFNSDQGLPGITPNPNPGGSCQGGLPATPLDQRCSVPVNPRNPADIRFDGGDRIISSGGPLSLLHPMDPLSPYIGGATEIISRQAVAAARSYSIPVGEDSYSGDGSVTEPFKYVDLDLVAFEDGTRVFIDSPGAGTVSVILDRGEHYSSRGLIDDTTAAPAITINEGTKVSTTGPIAGMIFTGGDGTFAVRMYTLLPDLLHSTDYVLTAPGDDPALQGSRPLNLYILNPDPLTPIAVSVTDSVGTATINIPANSMLDYYTGMGRFVPTGSTVRLTSDRSFWGVSAYDHRTPANDWGHSWLARKFLTETYTVSFAPGVNNPAFQSQPAQRLANDPNCAIPPAGAGTCDPLNRSPIFVSATLDNTEVRFDLDNDGLFDLVDNDGDDCPDQGAATDATCAPVPAAYDGACGLAAGAAARCIYSVDALESLRAYDFVDYDNSGTRIVANKPVSVAYGQDTDQAIGGDPIQDTGYTIYPINQLFLDPVLVVDKEASATTVPTGGGIVTYTLTVRSHDFDNLANLLVYDLLPPGVAGADYVPGSTLITYPDLTQNTADPATSIDAGTGRHRLDWFDANDDPDVHPDPITLGAHQILTIRYDIAIPDSSAPAQPIRLLTNEGHAEVTLGGSVFSPFDTADVVQTDVVLNKSSSDDGSPSGGENMTFTLTVESTGVTNETNVVISDAIPADTTFLPGSIVSAGPFNGAYDASQNAVVWDAPLLAAGDGPFGLSFRVTINPLVPAGTLIPNRGGYESAETPYFLSNEVEPVVVGPSLVFFKTGPALLHPNEGASFEITVRNVGADAANSLLISDPFPANTTYVAGSMEWSPNAQPFASLTDAADTDPGTAFADRIELALVSLGPREDVTFRFQVQVDPGTDGLFVNNQATISSDEVPPTDTNLVQAPIVGGGDATGHVFLDLDGNGVQNGSEPDLANVDVVVTDPSGATQTAITDANGDWLATVGLTQSCYVDRVNALGYSGSDGALDWSGTPWFEANDDNDPATGYVQAVNNPPAGAGNSFRLTGGPSAGQNRTLSRPVDLSAFASAIVDLEFWRTSMEGSDSVAVEVSYNGGGSFSLLGTIPGGTGDTSWQTFSAALDPAQLPSNQVVVRLRTNNFNYSNDTLYFDDVSVCGVTASANVDESDPDIPAGATLTTGNDLQTFDVVPGGTFATDPVGYRPLPLTFTKASDAGSDVVPGQTLTYTLDVTNYTGVSQTGVSLVDPVPAGTSYVAGSVAYSAPAFRVTEYRLGPGDFAGTTYDLTLGQALAPDYFAIVQGSDGDGTANGTRGPDENYAAVTADPFGTGDLATSGGVDVLTLTRGNAVNPWIGVVTVVECLGGCTTSGFRLLDVQRVAHTGSATGGTDTSGTAWTDLGRVALLGGFNGAGCDTAEGNAFNTKTCHVRLWPSGVDSINWSRDGGGATLSTATSTVMAVQWGSEWIVESARVQGPNGGDGLNATGEYNVAAIAAVPRAATWVWATGHTDDNGLGDSSEGVVVTLGDGVNQNATETAVAVGTEYIGTNVDFQVWALHHPDLVASQAFVNDGGGADPDGDTGDLIVDVTVPAAPANRMALAYNSQSGTGTAFPRPFFSARYLNDTTIRMERRRSGQPFTAWVQGVDFDALEPGAGSPPALLAPADGVTIAPGETLTLTFQVVVDDPLDPSITEIVNTATLNTDQQGPYVASVTDTVVRPSVIVEPNNAGYAVAGDTITYTHQVVNTCTRNDSFTITGGGSYLGWLVELLDPDTGAVIAQDTDGDGVWEGGVAVNTGTLPPGGFVEYDVRVTVPAGTAVGTEETTGLVATSNRSAAVVANGTDETTVVDAFTGTGQVYFTPDNSGIVKGGEWTAYSHYVVNDTAEADTFDLEAQSSRAWEEGNIEWLGTFHWDANGDGVYTPGTDLQIANTAQLLPGGSQLVFYVVSGPPGASPGDVDVAHLTATSRNHPGDIGDPDDPTDDDPTLFAAATDTTTVVGDPAHDLSGGGSLLVADGDVPLHPGTLRNLGDADDRYNLSISVSNLFGVDGLLHATELWMDTDADGVTDTEVATDVDGDGTWDFVDPAWDTDGDLLPDIAVSAGRTAGYELRRPLDPAQAIRRDHVTLTSTSIGFPGTDPDNVTATWVFAAATRAAIRGVRVDPGGEVSFVTANQVGTASFTVYQTADPSGAEGREPLHESPVLSPVPHSLTPILYRVPTRPITKPYVMIEELETDGGATWKGPFAVGDERLSRAFDTVELLMAEAGIARDSIQQVRGLRPLSLMAERAGSRLPALQDQARTARGSHTLQRTARPLRRRAANGVKIHVHRPGRVKVSTDALRAAGLRMRRGDRLILGNMGHLVPYQWEQDDAWSLVFEAQALSTDYSGSNVYTVTVGSLPRNFEVPFTVSADRPTPGFTRVEKSTLYVPSLPRGADPWQWDFLFSGWPWPDPGWDPAAGDFDLPGLAPDATGPVEVRIRLVGYTHHAHTVTATINGLPVGSVTFDGAGGGLLVGSIEASALAPTGNTLSLTYVGTDLPDSTEPYAMAYLDYLDLAVASTPVAEATWDLSPYEPRLPALGKAEYLVVTHPLFRTQADRIAALKAAEGLRAVVVETDAAYDRFSGGIVEPRAIQALIRHTFNRSRGALRFVLLVGDDTFDPRDYVGVGSQSFVPSFFGRDASWGLVPTETPYADVDDDGRRDLAIGRLPVHSVDEAAAVVDKIADQTEALEALQQRLLVVADDYSDTDAPFPVEAANALSLLPPTASVRWSLLEQGSATARGALLEGWEAGAMTTHYFGHGGLTEWADEQILTTDDVAALGSTWKPTVLFTWACLSQWHLGIDGPSLNEALLLQPVGGAVASFGPAGITSPVRQDALRDALYRQLAQPGTTLGEAILHAKNAALDREPRTRDVVEGFQLFGDPSLQIPWPAVVPQ